MSLVRVKQKYQVTIPPHVRNAVKLREGDLLEAEVKDGAIILHPQTIRRQAEPGQLPEEKQARFEMMMSYFGAGRGVFSSKKEIDDYIRRERDSWDE